MSEEKPGNDETVTKPESGEEQHETPPLPTQSQDAPPSQWSMPNPVFQQTSGYLPQGYLKQIEDAKTDDDVLDIPAIPVAPPMDAAARPAGNPYGTEQILETGTPAEQPIAPVVLAETPDTAADQEIPTSPSNPAFDIEPQPDLSQQIEEEVIVAAPAAPVKAKSGTLRTVLIVIALLGMFALLVAFLAFVYLYFIARPGEINNF